MDSKGDIEMTRLGQVETESLLKHGMLMIALGTAVCALGSLMAQPIRRELGHLIASTAIGTYLLIALLSAGLREKQVFSQRITAAYFAVGSGMVCYAILVAIQSNSLDEPLVSLIVGLLGLFWASWYLRIAFTFSAVSPQAIGLCALAAVNSSLSVTIGTRTELSKLTSVTVSGCYTILLGVQIYITAVVFHSVLEREKVVDQS
jgi:hypothetical protein